MKTKIKGFTIETHKCWVTNVYDKNGNQIGESYYDFSPESRDYQIELLKKELKNKTTESED